MLATFSDHCSAMARRSFNATTGMLIIWLSDGVFGVNDVSSLIYMGILYAMMEKDLKRLLAYSTIEEGISSSRCELGAVWDLVVWVECPRDLRLRRGIERDGEAMRWKWETVWMPEEEEYVRTQDPIGRANLVIDGSDSQFYEQST